MGKIPESFRDFFEREVYAHFATNLPDGRPHVVPVWFDYDEDDDRVHVVTDRGTRKEKNVRADPSVAISAIDPEDPSRHLLIWGTVVERTHEGAVEQAHAHAQRYLGVESDPNLDEDRAMLLKIEPDNVITSE